MKSTKLLKSINAISSKSVASVKKFSGNRVYVIAFLAFLLIGSLWYLSSRTVREGMLTEEEKKAEEEKKKKAEEEEKKKTAGVNPPIAEMNDILKQMMSKVNLK